MELFGFWKNKKEAVKKEIVKEAPVESTPKSEIKKEVKVTPPPSKKKGVVVPTASKALTESVADYTDVLITPRITEKSTIISEENNVYTFNVHPDATKQEVSKAVENHYKVKPVKVNIAYIKRKRILRRGKKGMKAGGKKAMVYLKKGDKIEFV